MQKRIKRILETLCGIFIAQSELSVEGGDLECDVDWATAEHRAPLHKAPDAEPAE